MSQAHNAGQNNNTETGTTSFERVEQSKYLGTILTNPNYIHEEINSRLKYGNANSYSMHILWLPVYYKKI